MGKHVVGASECVSSVAAKHGFRTHDSVYDHPDNAELRALRPDPSQLHPGDVLFVPTLESGKEEALTGRLTTFVVRRERTFLKIRLRYREPLAYRITTDQGDSEGLSNGEGLITAPIARDAQSASLVVWRASQSQHPDDGGPSLTVDVRLGQLAPLDTLRGVQGRLRNLGFYDGPLATSPDAPVDPITREAIERFQMDRETEVTGNVEDIRTLLAQLHDG